MSDEKATKKTLANPLTLADADIKTSPIERRSFLAMVGLPTAAAAAALVTGSCKSADSCDSDGRTDADPTDRVGRGRNDPCDTDQN